VGSGIAHGSIVSIVEAGGNVGLTNARFTGQTANVPGIGLTAIGLFGEDALSHTDRTHQWNSVRNNSGIAIGLPSYLPGGEYIVLPNDRRDNSAYSLTVTISQPAFVYLFIDNRGGTTDGVATTPPDVGTGTNSLSLPFMNWVLTSGFAPLKTGLNRTGNAALPDEVGLDTPATPLGSGPGNSVDDYASVYGKSIGAGSFVLAEYAAATNTGRNMYGVVVHNVPEPTSICLLAFGSLLIASHRSRRAREEDNQSSPAPRS